MENTLDLTGSKEHLLKVIQLIKDDHQKFIQESESKVLFEDSDRKREKLLITLSMCKIPEIPEDGKVMPMTIKSSLPHGYIDELYNVLLISRDLKGHIKKSRPYDVSLQHFKDLLRDHKCSHLVTQVMPLKQLRNDFVENEAKRLLSDRFDYILCDAAVIKRVPAFLGKAFYGNNKKPVQINLKDNKLAKAMKNALSKCIISLSMNGATASGQFGRMDQSKSHLADNLLAVVENLKKRIPGGPENLRSLHVSCRNVSSIPIFHNTVNPKDLPKIKHPNEKAVRIFTGPLTTLSGSASLVTIRGTDITLLNENEDHDKIVKLSTKLRTIGKNKYDPKTGKIKKANRKRLLKRLRKNKNETNSRKNKETKPKKNKRKVK